MTRTRRPAMILGIVGLSALLFAGCTVVGGGTLPSETGAKKATFGFTWITDNEEESTLAKGAWSDGYVKFKIVNGIIVTESENGDGCGIGMGEYVSTNRAYPGGGQIIIQICDNGEPGINGDQLAISLDGDAYDGYSNEGTITGGNLQVR